MSRKKPTYYYYPCERCGFKNGYKAEGRCWKCGYRLCVDYNRPVRYK